MPKLLPIRRPFSCRLPTSVLVTLSLIGATAAAGLAMLSSNAANAGSADSAVEIEPLHCEIMEAQEAALNAETASLSAGTVRKGQTAADKASAPKADVSTDPGAIVLLWSMNLPFADDQMLARDAVRLGIPFVLSGLPVIHRSPETLQKRPEPAASKAPPAGAADKPLSPFVIDRQEAARLGALAERLGVSAAVSSEVWHAVRDQIDHEPQVPALVIFGRTAIEVFPGSVRPLWTLAWAADHAANEDVREAARRRIAHARLTDEARFLKP